MPWPTRFRNLLDLAQLPWFAAEGGRLVLRDRSIGPIIDMHAHLAFSFVRRRLLDLGASGPPTEHYLDCCAGLDLDLYMNRHFDPPRLREVKRDLIGRSWTRRGLRRTHTVPNLLREMDELGIERAVLLSIELPYLSQNTLDWLAATRGSERLIVFGSVHPYTPFASARLDEQLHAGARGLKMHPIVQNFRPDDPLALRVYRAAGERGIPVFWHSGPVGIEPRLGRYFAQMRFYERPIAEHPRTTFVLGHAGALQVERAIELQRTYPNVVLELASQSYSALQRILAIGDPDRIVYGTDWPLYHQAPQLAKVLMATEDRRELRHKVLYANAARLLGLR